MIKSFFIFLFFLTVNFSHAQSYAPEKSLLPVLDFSKRLSDRFYVHSTLQQIFGPSVKPTLYKYIFSKPNAFGGPCDVYEQIRPNGHSVADQMTSCFERNDTSTLPLIGRRNLLRMGYTLKACTAITNNNKAIDFALQAASLKKRDPSKIKIEKLYKLFYPFEKLDHKVETALIKIEKKHELRWVLYTLCIDPSWQVL
ncbi:MAG: hypothetical protein CME70_13535 [Halobacteriovorax sp.]|nr:hypothetical protein [Halobacteriovorax sp.]|tara:strand:+ start:14426 stop:15019 length:594 start_codon:yes stop_codon:yes gene_type:complete